MCVQAKAISLCVCVFVQAKAIRSLGCAAEAVTVGHNPYCKASAMDHSIVLPTTRKRFCCEVWPTYACSAPSQCKSTLAEHVNFFFFCTCMQVKHESIPQQRL